MTVDFQSKQEKKGLIALNIRDQTPLYLLFQHPLTNEIGERRPRKKDLVR